MYSASDTERPYSHDAALGLDVDSELVRSAFRRDYARILHSASLRRLQFKTQLYPNFESDFFRTRLAHSLEVAQIAKSIAILINKKHLPKDITPIDTDLVELASLAHDIGHPPFGHNGEKTLDNCMKNNGGFETNAQTVRVLSRLEKKVKDSFSGEYGVLKGKDGRYGLNLSYRSLASILKYDEMIPKKFSDREKSKELKGYYHFDRQLIRTIKDHVVGRNFRGKFKTIECQIMDIADDIAYSTYDLEDSFKASFIAPLDLINLNKHVVKEIAKRCHLPRHKITESEVVSILNMLFLSQLDRSESTNEKTDTRLARYLSLAYNTSKEVAQDSYARTLFTSELVSYFIDGIQFVFNSRYPQLSLVRLEPEVLKLVEILKQLTFVTLIRSPRLQVAEYRSKEIITSVFDCLKKNPSVLPEDFKHIYDNSATDMKARVICDFIAGMTDRYLIEYYCRLFSENAQSIYKPLY
jgi:dGTPase